MPTEFAARAHELLRDGSNFQWYIVPLFAFVVYIYAAEIERRNWNLVLAGLAFWGMDWLNEIANGLVFHATNYAPVWATPGDSAFVILIGLNFEICCMFAVAGIAFAKMLPADKKMKILGIPNRLLMAVVGSAFCVVVEVLLNAVGALTWDYAWWNTGAPWLIFLLGYLPFFLVSFWVYDMDELRKKVTAIAVIYAVDAVCLVVFGGILGWI